MNASELMRLDAIERFMARAVAQFPSLGEPPDSLVCKAVPITDAPDDDIGNEYVSGEALREIGQAISHVLSMAEHERLKTLLPKHAYGSDAVAEVVDWPYFGYYWWKGSPNILIETGWHFDGYLGATVKDAPTPDAPGDDTRDAALAQMEARLAVVTEERDELYVEVDRGNARIVTLENNVQGRIERLAISHGCQSGCNAQDCGRTNRCEDHGELNRLNHLLFGTGEFAPKEKA